MQEGPGVRRQLVLEWRALRQSNSLLLTLHLPPSLPPPPPTGAAAALARSISASLGKAPDSVPCFLYGAAHPQGRPLADLRRSLGYFRVSAPAPVPALPAGAGKGKGEGEQARSRGGWRMRKKSPAADGNAAAAWRVPLQLPLLLFLSTKPPAPPQREQRRTQKHHSPSHCLSSPAPSRAPFATATAPPARYGSAPQSPAVLTPIQGPPLCLRQPGCVRTAALAAGGPLAAATHMRFPQRAVLAHAPSIQRLLLSARIAAPAVHPDSKSSGFESLLRRSSQRTHSTRIARAQRTAPAPRLGNVLARAKQSGAP